MIYICNHVIFKRVSLRLLSFQIQTRLQNLGSNLQNKSNDIEVLAVSHLCVYVPPSPISNLLAPLSHLIC